MALNHTMELYTTNADDKTFRVLTTKAKYIRPYVINQPISTSGQLGINAGFFASADYSAPPEADNITYPNESCGRSISWAKNYTKVYPYNGRASYKCSRGTVVIGTYNQSLNTLAEIVTVDSVETVNELYSDMDVTLKAMIGGGRLAIGVSDRSWRNNVYEAEGWTDELFPWYGQWGDLGDLAAKILAPDSSMRRSGLGLKEVNNEMYAYMVASVGNASIYELRHLFEELGCEDAIFLDGSNSVQMRWKDENNVIREDISNASSPRYIWNIVSLINVN